MPVQLPYIQPLSSDQLFGGRAASDTHATNQLANALQAIKLQYAPRRELADTRTAEEQAPYVHSLTDVQNQTAKWYGPKAQAEIGLQGAQAGYANKQTSWYDREAKSKIDAALSHSGYENAEAAKLNFLLKNPGLLGGANSQDLTGTRLEYERQAAEDAKRKAMQPNAQPPASPFQLTNGMSNLGTALSNAQSAGGNQFSPMNSSQQPVGAQLAQGLAPLIQQQNAQQQANQQALQPQQAPQEKPQTPLEKAEQYIKDINEGRHATPLAKAEHDVLNATVDSNPQVKGDKTKASELISRLDQGFDEDTDGKPIEVTRPMYDALDKKTMMTHGATVYQQSLRNQQANAAAETLTSKQQELRGDPEIASYFNIPIETAIKQLSSDPKNEEKLGKFIAANGIGTEAVKEQLWRIGTRPTVTDTNRILADSMQQAHIPNFRMTNNVRNTIAKEMNGASKEAFDARNNISSHPFDVMRGGRPKPEFEGGPKRGSKAESAVTGAEHLTDAEIEALRKKVKK